MTNKNGHKTHIIYVLDESWSMNSCRDATIDGFNEFLDSQRDKTLGETRVTLIKFNSDAIKTVFSDTLIDDVPPLARADYLPACNTPLMDAIAHAIRDTEHKTAQTKAVLSKMAGHNVKVGPLVIMVIMTDGMENASQEYTRDKIFQMITEKKNDGWDFVYLGANQDSWMAANPLGIDHGNITNYSSDPIGTRRAFAGVAMGMASYRLDMGNLTNAARAASAVGDKKTADDKLKAMAMRRTNYFKGKKKL